LTRFGVGGARSSARRQGEMFLGARRRGQETRERVAKFSSARGLQPGDVRSSLRRAPAGEGAEAHDLQPGEEFGACRRGRRRWGARSAVQRRGDVFFGACWRGRRRGGLKFCQLRAAWGATVQLSGIWLGLWVSASGGAAQSASMFISSLFALRGARSSEQLLCNGRREWSCSS